MKPFGTTDLKMSNFDHTIDDGLEEALKDGHVTQHAAWNFCGYVRWEEHSQEFVEEVWVRRRKVDELRASSLPLLMEKVNAIYGSE